MAEKKVKFDYMVGTMIKIPRGALTANKPTDIFPSSHSDLRGFEARAAISGSQSGSSHHGLSLKI